MFFIMKNTVLSFMEARDRPHASPHQTPESWVPHWSLWWRRSGAFRTEPHGFTM